MINNKPSEKPNEKNESNNTTSEIKRHLDAKNTTRDAFCNEIVLAMMEDR